MDCDDSLCMDPVKLRRFCETECFLEEEQLIHKSSGKIVKAVIVVHVFGNLADMEAIMEIAGQYHLKVIEDATEALGTYYTEGRYKGKFAGTIGDFGAYSFNGNKIITTGGGGAVTGRKEKEIQHIQYLSTQAKDDVHYYIHHEVGYNYRMTNVQAALGVAQMEELKNLFGGKTVITGCTVSFWRHLTKGGCLHSVQEPVRTAGFYAVELDQVNRQEDLHRIISALQEKGIQSRAIWGLIHEQKPYQSALTFEIKKAVEYSRCVINLPCSTQIAEDEICYVVEQLKEICGRYSGGMS